MAMKKYEHLFYPDDESGKTLKTWWEDLGKDTGGRAELRRAKDPEEVVFSSSYHRLYNKLQLYDKEALACVAGLCAHIKNNRMDFTFAEQMAEGDRPKVSNLRFRSLLSITERDELFRTMIRIINILDGSVNLCNLARTVYWWNNMAKKQLAYDYYAKAKIKK